MHNERLLSPAELCMGVAWSCRYSFGTGVEVLPIPELVPFRLTRYERESSKKLSSDTCFSAHPMYATWSTALRKQSSGFHRPDYPPAECTSAPRCVCCEGCCKARCSPTTRARCWPRRLLQPWRLCGLGGMRSRCESTLHAHLPALHVLCMMSTCCRHTRLILPRRASILLKLLMPEPNCQVKVEHSTGCLVVRTQICQCDGNSVTVPWALLC